MTLTTQDVAYYQQVPQMALLEGACPKHLDHEVKVQHVGGTFEFIKENVGYVLEAETYTLWKNRLPGDHTDGEITFKCPEGCTWVIAHNDFGDWNL